MLKKVVDISNYLFGGLFNIGLAIALIVLAYFVTTWAFDQGASLLGSDDYLAVEASEIVIEIPEGAGRREIAQLLEEYGLIDNWWMFYFESFFNGSANHFRHGTFNLNTAMGNSYIMYALGSLEYLHVEEGRILVIEGLTNWQIAELAATMGYFTARDFLDELEHGTFLNLFISELEESGGQNRLQGFLFPATYNLPPNPSPQDLIVRMLDAFEDNFTQEMWGSLAQMHFALGWQPTLAELITIASIIEVETTVAEERPIVASIIYNRLAAGMPLEKVSTVVFATNTRYDMLAPSHFNNPSPYNTFNRQGLPVGPISNPGLNAIQSTLNPANTDYLFMAALNDGDGRHFFTSDRDQYLAFIAARDAADGDDVE
ncbi:MAG: endolytic transglycosylase MltG [Defluviitaleaceae bacterium]|nr:endolytic transglycosylase MltG [Defluviitaleaceae bacterium]